MTDLVHIARQRGRDESTDLPELIKPVLPPPFLRDLLQLHGHPDILIRDLQEVGAYAGVTHILGTDAEISGPFTEDCAPGTEQFRVRRHAVRTPKQAACRKLPHCRARGLGRARSLLSLP
jgi:hypothetical protein